MDSLTPVADDIKVPVWTEPQTKRLIECARLIEHVVKRTLLKMKGYTDFAQY